MNTKLSTLLLSVIFGLTACSVDDTSITPSDNPDDISWEKPDYTSVKCDDPVFISDGIKPEVRVHLTPISLTSPRLMRLWLLW